MYLLEGALSLLFLIGGSEQAATASQAPPVVATEFGESSDLLWARRIFDDPAAWSNTVSSAETRRQIQTASLDAQIASVSGHPVRLQDECGRDIGCFAILEMEALRPTLNARTFEQDRAEAARMVAAALSTASDLDKEARDATLPEPARILAFGRRDQALRGFFNALYDDATLSKSSQGAQGLAVIMIRMELRRRDLEAADFMSSVIAQNGWPKRESHGEKVVEAAWLIAQHADRDPLFQVKALSLLEKTLPNNPDRMRDYAFLFDRVAVALGDPQRYATQIVCQGHNYRIGAVEDLTGLDDRRRQIGLNPIASRVSELGEPC